MTLCTPGTLESVAKAVARASDSETDLSTLNRLAKNAVPQALADFTEKQQRRAFVEAQYGESRAAQAAFERIIEGNDLQDANFFIRGALAARAVLRVVLRDSGGVRGYGTGFLIGEGVLITNNHVLPNSDVAAAALAEAFYEHDAAGDEVTPWRFALDTSLFFTTPELDFSVVGVRSADQSGAYKLAELGWLPLIGGTGKAAAGEWLSAIQHPNGERKQICIRENQLLKRDTDVLWYSTDTLAGSSGSPIFNSDWLVVALHHSGVPQTRDGKWQTVDGRDFDPSRDREDSIKWIANEGIRVSRIVETLRTDPAIMEHPKIKALVATGVGELAGRLPVLYANGVAPPVDGGQMAQKTNGPDTIAQDTIAQDTIAQDTIAQDTDGKGSKMADRMVTLRLAISEDGQVRVLGQEAEALLVEKAAAKKKPALEAPVEEETDWATGGYDPDFLNRKKEKSPKLHVPLPVIAEDLAGDIAPLKAKSVYGLPVPSPAEQKAGILKYWNYSVVMNKARRLAFFSAANINGGPIYDLSRSPDKWLWDDRIARTHQVGNTLYTGNKFDRGHLTRREDLEWGDNPVEATRRANGTCTWTNCTPQHLKFNQGKDDPGSPANLWAGLEKYVLEQTARHYQFRVQTFTGPIFDDADPEYRGIQIPLRFFKVVAAVDANGELFATGYVLSQEFLVEQDWNNLDEAAVAQPFGAFETYQTPLAEIEKATGLTFHYGIGKDLSRLSECDPLQKELAKPVWRRRRGGGYAVSSRNEAAITPGRSLTDPLKGFGDILLP